MCKLIWPLALMVSLMLNSSLLQVKPILARLKTTLAGSTAALFLSAGLLVGLVQAGTDADGIYGELLACWNRCVLSLDTAPVRQHASSCLGGWCKQPLLYIAMLVLYCVLSHTLRICALFWRLARPQLTSFIDCIYCLHMWWRSTGFLVTICSNC